MQPKPNAVVIGSSLFAECFSDMLQQRTEIAQTEYYRTIIMAGNALSNNNATYIFLDADTDRNIEADVREVRLMAAQSRIIVFIADFQRTDIKALIAAGANSVISKTADIEIVREAIQQTINRKYYLCPVSFTHLMKQELMLTEVQRTAV